MLVNLVNLVDSLEHIYDKMLSYLNSMSDIANKKYEILVRRTITFNIIVFNQQK